MKRRYAVDRFEGDIMVLVADDDCSVLNIKKNGYNLSPNDVVDVVFLDDKITAIEKIEGLGESRVQKNLARLHALANKNKK